MSRQYGSREIPQRWIRVSALLIPPLPRGAQSSPLVWPPSDAELGSERRSFQMEGYTVRGKAGVPQGQ